jgi:hypothetical protein
MNLRERNYPPNYWLNLHHHIQPASPFVSLKQHRKPTPKRIDSCLLHLYPFIQKIIYSGAIDRKKGHVRSSKIPITPEQFNLIKKLGGSYQYSEIVPIEETLKFQYDFQHKGYHRGVENLQFRVQKQKAVVLGKNPLLLLRLRFQQKQPKLIQ